MPDIIKTDEITQVSDHHRSELNDLIGRPPGWILRSGIVAIALVFIAMLTGAGFIKYPDKIQGKGIMNSDYPPTEHYHVIEGVVQEVFVKDRQKIEKNQPILYLENLTSREDLHLWMNFMNAYESIVHIPDFLHLEFPDSLFLGELQPDYTRMQMSFQSFIITLNQSGVFRQINTLSQELKYNKSLKQLYTTDRELTEAEYALVEKDHRRTEHLHKEKVLSDLDKEKSQAELIRFQKQLNNTGQSLIQNQIRDRQLQLEIDRLTEERATKVAEHRLNMLDNITNARDQIRSWEEKYFVKTKSNGILQLEPGIVPSRRIRPGELIATVVSPQKDSRRYIQVMQPGSAMSGIQEGLAVIIRFDAFPYKEYGVLKAGIEKISLTPRQMENGLIYDIQIPLQDTIRTSYGLEIPFSPRSGVMVEFITEDKSILQRILGTFLDLIKNR